MARSDGARSRRSVSEDGWSLKKCERKKDHLPPAAYSSTGGERTDVFNVQVLEVVRTQWIPACAGMTVFKFCK